MYYLCLKIKQTISIMNELVINYHSSKTQKILSLVIGGYITLFGLYQCVMYALSNSFAGDFFMMLVAVVLGIILILNVTLWAPKPILIMNTESIYINMPNQKGSYQSEWANVEDVSIGISYLKMSETDTKIYNLDLSELKYSDLREVKTRVIEICESKNIPYKND